jgi:hypothetical protein
MQSVHVTQKSTSTTTMIHGTKNKTFLTKKCFICEGVARKPCVTNAEPCQKDCQQGDDHL